MVCSYASTLLLCSKLCQHNSPRSTVYTLTRNRRVGTYNTNTSEIFIIMGRSWASSELLIYYIVNMAHSQICHCWLFKQHTCSQVLRDQCQPFLQPGQLTWLHIHGLSFTPKSWTKNFWRFIIWVPFMHGPLPETWSMKRPSQPPPVSGLPSSVEAQISATRASTSVVFASTALWQ